MSEEEEDDEERWRYPPFDRAKGQHREWGAGETEKAMKKQLWHNVNKMREWKTHKQIRGKPNTKDINIDIKTF